jgi:DNA polymerase-3 subunit gamma/tau
MKAEVFILHPSSFILPMSLYRKYRPQTFEDVVGQDHVAHTLRNALAADPIRIAHAYLFCGPRGTGKTTSARLLAKCLNCEKGPTSTPCNECDFCVRVSSNQALMDLIEIDAASNRGIDNVRELIAGVNSAPSGGRYRIYIIDEVHMLTTESFNALLKTLEEPPPHAIFVLATTDAHKLPTTITSRCQRFDFRRVGPRDIVGRLQFVSRSEGMEMSEDAARLIAHSADGALRDALTLLEQVSAFSSETISEADVRLVLGTVSQELIDDLMRAVVAQDAVGVLQHIERAVDEGASFSQLTRDLVSYGRDLLLLTVGYEGVSTLSDAQKKTRHELANAIGRARLMAIVENLRATEKEMRQSTDHRLLLELALVRAASGIETQLSAPTPVAAPQAGSTPGAAPVAPKISAPPLAAPPGFQAPRISSKPAPIEPPIEEVQAKETPVEEIPVEESPAPQVEPDSQPERPQPVWREQGAQAGSTPDASEAESAPAPQPAAPKKKGRRIHNMEEFVELWPHVLMRIRRKIGVTAVAYLHDAYPHSLSSSDATLVFQKEFHFEKACEAAKSHPFEQVVNECLDAPRQLKFVLAERKPEPVKAPEPEPVMNDDDDEEENIFAMTQQLFAAEIIEQ